MVGDHGYECRDHQSTAYCGQDHLAMIDSREAIIATGDKVLHCALTCQDILRLPEDGQVLSPSHYPMINGHFSA